MFLKVCITQFVCKTEVKYVTVDNGRVPDGEGWPI